ncbi:MAG: TIGR02147 family protein [Ignavibacteria bacterium]|nr:TIGR02147 family protein [Ignavibacteria bacterium]
MKKIFDYLDYRDYLREYYEEKKAENPFFSYKLFGRMVDIDQSYLAKVLIKERHIAQKSIRKFIEYFKLSDIEAEYFETLVHFIKAKTDKQSRLFFEKLLSFKEVKRNILTTQQYEFYTKWYYSAIRSLLQFYDFQGDYKKLAEQLSPPISAGEAKQAINLLQTLQLIKQDADGRYVLADKAITSGKEWHSLAINSFQEQTIGMAAESVARHKRELRDISTVTMNIGPADLQRIKELIQQFRNTVIQYVNDNASPENVYQLNVQLYPLTNVSRKKE